MTQTEKVRISGYWDQVKENPKLYDRLTKNEKLNFITHFLIRDFKLIAHFRSREILAFKNNSYSKLTKKFYDRVEMELSSLTSGSYNADKRNILEKITDRTAIEEEDFSWDSWIVVFKNGTYDVETGIFYPVYEEEKKDGYTFKNLNLQGTFFYEIPLDYEEGNFTCKKFKKSLVEWIDEKTTRYHRKGKRILLINDIFEQIGLTFTMNTFFKKSFMNLGPKDSGKTQLTNILIKIIGKENIATRSLQDICDNRFATQTLQHKIANIRSENPASLLKGVEMFKALTGDDALIPAEIKRGPFFDFKNVAKFWFNCNQAPKLKYDDDAFYERFIINKFPNQFSEGKDKTKLNFAHQYILNNPKEIQGIVHEAIKGIKRLHERGTFRTEILKNTKHLMQYSNNIVYRFMIDYCIRGPYSVKSDDFMDSFKRITGDTKFEKRNVTQQLKKFGITHKQIRPSRDYFYKGIKLKEITPQGIEIENILS